ncbi:DUF4034 domain-containing protein [Pseudomonas sp. NPDC089401]|uniref:DUF4034 domain-containing protein n=1 Tax=Pseudomonas sp. NPDC089401 TaxID=3364462 RepID=UPI0038036C1A
MQTPSRTRQHIRERVQANDFAELNRYFDSLQAQWRQAPRGECPAYLAALQGYMLLGWDNQGAKALTRTLKAWIDACPKAYHPQVVMGFHCFNRACHIRGNAAANEVSDEHWLAAEQACEMAAAHFLRAIERSAQPVAALIGMLQISAHFREPGWLVELFHGQAARFRPSAHADVEVQEGAAPLLVRHGLAPLVDLPQALPGNLPARDAESPQAYWLYQALAGFPGCFEAIEAYARYLTPRWGGRYDAIDTLASGPLCEGWTEMQRNAIRWLALEDQFWLPRADQLQQIAVWKKTFEQWHQRPLRPRERATLLARRGAFRRHSLHDCSGAMGDFVASVELYPDQGFVPTIGEPFYSFACLVLIHGMADPSQAFRSAIERLCENPRQAAACALRAVGQQFGLWGFARCAEQAQVWLRIAVMRQCGREGQGFDVLEVSRLLWTANRHDAALYLYQGSAGLKLPDAAMALHDLYRGALANTPEQYLDSQAAQHWLLRAVEDGSPMARYTLACQRMQDGEDLGQPDALRSVRRLLLDALGHAGTDAGARLQLGMLLRQFGDRGEQVEGVDYLLELVEHPDSGVAARACAELGLAWMHGQGTRRHSRFAAIEWVDRAVALQPGDAAIERIQAQVCNSRSRVKTLITLCGAALFRGDLQASELPPKPAGPAQDQHRASA